jgi:hydroxyacylglutathione hydrolase
VILEQYYLGCLAHASYLVADETSGEAAVVDPQRDDDQYVRDASRLGVRMPHVCGAFLAPRVGLEPTTLRLTA